MRLGSVITGIGGFDLGFERAGCTVAWQIERELFCQRVLAKHWPNVTMHDDVTTANALEPVDVLVGGFPCQDVSVAGKRAGLAGARSGLFFEFMRLADELRPKVLVVENVPGLLTSHGGRDFHTVLATLAELGWRRAYRILDSQYFGVAQRRRRVFIVACRGGLGLSPEAVLFERTRGDWYSQTGQASWADLAGPVAGGAYGSGRRSEDDPNLVLSHSLTAQHGVTEDGTGRGTPLVLASSGERARALTASMHKRHDEDTDTLIAATLNSGVNSGGFRTEPGEHLVAPSLATKSGRFQVEEVESYQVAYTQRADPGGRGQGHNTNYVNGVRRLTPTECERLQAFPDGWTCLCGCAPYSTSACKCTDSPRYRALGNAVTVSVAEFIGKQLLSALQTEPPR